MKLVRNLAAALVLACVLTGNVYAGDQNTPPAPPSEPSTSYETPSDKTLATSDTDGKVDLEAEESDLLTTALLALLSLY